MAKNEDAFRTIGELSDDLGIAQHILRYWETRFPQLKPMTRAGNRRYYRPDDVALVKQIHSLLNEHGYTIKGVQKILAGKADAPDESPAAASASQGDPALPADTIARLKKVRDTLAEALAE